MGEENGTEKAEAKPAQAADQTAAADHGKDENSYVIRPNFQHK